MCSLKEHKIYGEKITEIKNSVVLVTGASSGIGYHLAKQLALKEAKVIAIARRLDKLETLQKDVLKTKSDSEIICFKADITMPEQIKSVVKQIIKSYGKIDILINNAGVGLFGDITNASIKDVRRTFEVNFFGILGVIQNVAPHMINQNKGHIVNISSYLGNIGLPNFGCYCASKWAVNGLTESLRYELINSNIKVTLVCPGTTDTEFIESGIYNKNFVLKKIHKGQPPQDVAKQIIKAIETNKKRITLTNKAKLITLLKRISPDLADIIICFIKKNPQED